MDISSLFIELDRIVSESNIGAADFFEALAGMAKRGEWTELEKMFGPKSTKAIRQSYEKDPIHFIQANLNNAEECRAHYVSDATKRLTRLGRTNFAGLDPVKDNREYVQIVLDSREGLLTVAFAFKLINLIELAAIRARGLREIIVAEASSEEADSYLSEACECYFLGLFSASAIMCRSALEEALERKLPSEVLRNWQADAKTRKQELTLGALLHKVNNHDILYAPADFLRLAREVNQLATRGAHTKPISTQEAKDCLSKARKAIAALLEKRTPHR